MLRCSLADDQRACQPDPYSMTSSGTVRRRAACVNRGDQRRSECVMFRRDLFRGDVRRSSLTRSEKGASHNPFSRRTNNAAEIVSAERGFSGRWKVVSQATFSLSRCERSGLQCDGMSLSGQPWMALCKWQPGPFSHSSQLLQPLTSQRQEQLAQPVPLAESLQRSQPDLQRKMFQAQEIRIVT
jgi:hypothetical protein